MGEDNINFWCHPKIDLKADIDDLWSMGANMYIEPLEERVVDYSEKKFIAFKQFVQGPVGEGHCYWIIPGFVVGELKHYDPKKEANVDHETNNTLIEKVFSDQEKADIKELLNYESVTFWS
tara:strand:+ start:1214 stop:1576 length:363 start_codon:yes stop_codon:yes gene_type:complete